MKQTAGYLLAIGLSVISGGVLIFFIDLSVTTPRPQFIAWYSAAVFVFMTCPISLLSIWGHINNMRDPSIQRYVVRLLALPSLYAVQSWLALRFHDQALLFGSIRDCYEAYAIYCFFNFLIAVLGGPERVIKSFRSHSRNKTADHPFPFSLCIKPWPLFRPQARAGEIVSPFMTYCQAGVVQYVILKVSTTIVSVTLDTFGLFGEGQFTWYNAYPYIALINNCSQIWAMYCLVQFYSICQLDLRGVRPVAKLVAVKSVVFFTYSQSCVIMALHWKGMLPSALENPAYHWSTEDVAKGLQDWLICVEMFIASVVFRDVFSHREYKEVGLLGFQTESEEEMEEPLYANSTTSTTPLRRQY